MPLRSALTMDWRQSFCIRRSSSDGQLAYGGDAASNACTHEDGDADHVGRGWVCCLREEIRYVPGRYSGSAHCCSAPASIVMIDHNTHEGEGGLVRWWVVTRSNRRCELNESRLGASFVRSGRPQAGSDEFEAGWAKRNERRQAAGQRRLRARARRRHALHSRSPRPSRPIATCLPHYHQPPTHPLLSSSSHNFNMVRITLVYASVLCCQWISATGPLGSRDTFGKGGQ